MLLAYSIHLVEDLLDLLQVYPSSLSLLNHHIYQFYKLMAVSDFGHPQQVLSLLCVVKTQFLPVVVALEGLVGAGREEGDS